MTQLAPIAFHDPSDYIGVDGCSAARLVHFGNDLCFERYHRPVPQFAQQAVAAFVEHAVNGGSKDVRYFAEDFGPEPLRNIGWCGTVTHHSLRDVAEQLKKADEMQVRGDRYGNNYTIKSISQNYIVQRTSSNQYWDLIQDVVLGEITLTTEIMSGDGDRRLHSFESKFQRLWFWQQRREAPSVFTLPNGEVPSDWRNRKTIPEGYLALVMID